MSGKHNGYCLTEGMVRYAFDNSTTNKEAAIFLNISVEAWRSYAKQYIHPDTGLPYNKSFYIKNERVSSRKLPLQRIKNTDLKKYLLESFLLVEECHYCKFSERNIMTLEVPLILNFIDGNVKNKNIENMELMCYNCTALLTEKKIIVK